MEIFDFKVETSDDPQPILLANGWSIAFIGNRLVLNGYEFDFCNNCLLTLSFQLHFYIAKTGDPCPFYSALIRFIGGNSDWTIEQYESPDFQRFIVSFPQYSVFHFNNLTSKLKERKQQYVMQRFRDIAKKLVDNHPLTLQKVGGQLVNQLQIVQQKLSSCIGNKWENRVKALQQCLEESKEEAKELRAQNGNLLAEIQKQKDKIRIFSDKVDSLKSEKTGLEKEIAESKRKMQTFAKEQKDVLSVSKKSDKLLLTKLQREKEESEVLMKGMQEKIVEKERLEKLLRESLGSTTLDLVKEKQKCKQLIELNKKTFVKFKELKASKTKVEQKSAVEWITTLKGDNTKETLDIILNTSKIMWCSNFGVQLKEQEPVNNFLGYIDMFIACIMSLPYDEMSEGMRAIWYDYYNFQKMKEAIGELVSAEIYNNVWKYCILCGSETNMTGMLPTFYWTIKHYCKDIQQFNRILEKANIEKEDFIELFYKN